MAPTSNSRYHMIPRNSIDSDDDSGADEALLRSPLSVNTTLATPRTACSMTINPYVALRLFSAVLTLISFILFVIFASVYFIAAAIFLMFCTLHNIFMLVHYAGGNRLSFSVEYQNKLWNLGSPAQSCTPSLGKLLDYMHAACLLITLTIGIDRRQAAHQQDYYWINSITDQEIAGVVLGYIALVLQVCLTIPRLDRLFCTFKVAVKPKGQANTDLPGHPARGPNMMQANTNVQGPLVHRPDVRPAEADLPGHLTYRPDVKQASIFDIDEPETTSIPETEQPAPVTADVSDLV